MTASARDPDPSRPADVGPGLSGTAGGPPAHPRPDEGWLVGQSEAVAALRRDVERLAAADVSVLVEGESGVGKNLVARALHRASPRGRGPLVEVDLSALAPNLIESELFGHEAGAFTGATARRLGRFQRAEGGTLVLDGVERLPELLQGKLLRALQERVVEPLGSERPVPVDVRIVATSGADLESRVRERRFREDLYYRLAVVRVRVPSLRERAADLRPLVDAYVARISARAHVPARVLAPGAFDRLRAHAWPGNLRELENALERVLVLGGAHGAVEAGEFAFLAEAVAGVPERLAREALAHGISPARFEAALLAEALRESRGNVAAAARLTGLTRRVFEVRLARHRRGEAGAEARDEVDDGESANGARG